MSQNRPEMSPLAGFAGAYVLRSGRLGCTTVRLKGDGLCIFSPLPDLGNAEFAELANLGTVSILLAPNHYHHRGIAQHLERFPQASLVCARGARPRLQKMTGSDFNGLDALSNALPPNIQLLEPEGLKTGEVWLQIETDDALAWIVCDCFSSEATTGTPTMLGTFPKFGIKDRAVYRSWVKSQIDRRPPTTLVPCHGLPITRPDLGISLGMLLDENVQPDKPVVQRLQKR